MRGYVNRCRCVAQALQSMEIGLEAAFSSEANPKVKLTSYGLIRTVHYYHYLP